VERIREVLGADCVFEITGNPVAPGAYSLPTILWLQQHEPDVFAAAHKLIVPPGNSADHRKNKNVWRCDR
jgi:sugar (pentulose or hexulose) kinase